MQPGAQQIAAAYALYSSATMLVASLGAGTFGFTLDPHCGHFLLTHHIRIPARGSNTLNPNFETPNLSSPLLKHRC